MQLQFRGQAFKDQLWSIASATTVQEFEDKMVELQLMNPECHQWLRQIPPKHWARSHFTGRAKTDVLLNNLCECLNGKLIDGRDKPIITALEFVREYLMKRIVNVYKVIERTDGVLTPKVSEKFEEIKQHASKLIVKWHGGSKFQVSNSGYNEEQCVVDVVDKTCSCRRWELTGIPCKHAVATNWDMALHGTKVDIPEKWVDPCYWLCTWKEVYSHKIGSINGRRMWPRSQCPSKLLQPIYHKPIGRPKKKRRKDALEKEDAMVKGNNLSRKGKTTTCGICGNKGHNRRACRGQGGATTAAKKKTTKKPAVKKTSAPKAAVKKTTKKPAAAHGEPSKPGNKKRKAAN